MTPMDGLNRHERHLLRWIQTFRQAALLDSQVVVEQLGTVDVYFHPDDPDPHLNCVTPHKGVAWVRRDDLSNAFMGLERLGRVPRLVFQEALFPVAFQQQLTLMGLVREQQQTIMVYYPLHGPVPAGEVLFGALPEDDALDVAVRVATEPRDLATWLRVFGESCHPDEDLEADPAIVAELRQDVEAQHRLFVTAYYQGTPLGVACAGLRVPTAELELVATAPLWHDLGMEDALIAAAIREARRSGAETVFTVRSHKMHTRRYRRLGFVDLTRVLTYRLLDDPGMDG